MGGGGGGMGNAFSGAYQGATSSMPPNLQGRGWDSAQNDWYNQQSQGAYQPGPDYSGYGARDWQREARQGGAGGPLSSMLGGMLRQQGYEQGVGPYADLGNRPGGFFGYGQGGPQGGYQQSYNQIYNNPAQSMQMGSQYGQLGPYNTMARDMASGNVGNYQFGYQGQPFTYQGGMNPQGRAGAWGRPQSASQLYGGLGAMGAGRGGMGRGMGLNYPQFGGGQPGGLFGGGSPFQYVGAGGGGYYNPMGRTPGVNPTSTPWGGVSNRHPLSSFLRLPGQQAPAAMTTGANQAGLAAEAMAGRGGGQGTQPIYQSDAWRRQQTGVPLPYQLPAAAGDIGKQRSQFLYGGAGPWQGALW